MANNGNPTHDIPAFTLSDAVTLYHKQIEQTHRYWNYLSVISLATITAAGTSGGRLGKYLLIGFVVFAVGNAVLVYLSQNEARRISTAIHGFLQATTQPIDTGFKGILQSLSTWPAPLIILGHLVMDAAVIYGVYKLTF